MIDDEWFNDIASLVSAVIMIIFVALLMAAGFWLAGWPC